MDLLLWWAARQVPLLRGRRWRGRLSAYTRILFFIFLKKTEISPTGLIFVFLIINLFIIAIEF
jgi:hypothetical protein